MAPGVDSTDNGKKALSKLWALKTENQTNGIATIGYSKRHINRLCLRHQYIAVSHGYQVLRMYPTNWEEIPPIKQDLIGLLV